MEKTQNLTFLILSYSEEDTVVPRNMGIFKGPKVDKWQNSFLSPLELIFPVHCLALFPLGHSSLIMLICSVT